jgi:hypothetical protein
MRATSEWELVNGGMLTWVIGEWELVNGVIRALIVDRSALPFAIHQ